MNVPFKWKEIYENKNKNLDINFEKPLLSFAILKGFQTKETYGWAFRRHMEKTNEIPKILRNNLNNFEILLNFGLISMGKGVMDF